MAECLAIFLRAVVQPNLNRYFIHKKSSCLPQIVFFLRLFCMISAYFKCVSKANPIRELLFYAEISFLWFFHSYLDIQLFICLIRHLGIVIYVYLNILINIPSSWKQFGCFIFAFLQISFQLFGMNYFTNWLMLQKAAVLWVLLD